jgi:hypothetical protein
MLALVEAIFGAFFAAFRPRMSLVAENLLLRQQLAILCRATPRPRLRPIDRAFWVIVTLYRTSWARRSRIRRSRAVESRLRSMHSRAETCITSFDRLQRQRFERLFELGADFDDLGRVELQGVA